MIKEQKQKAITLISMVITIVILLILAGVAIGTLGGENGLIAKVNQAQKAQIEAEMKEKLTLAISELQTEKEGKATLDDVTQDWADNNLTDYDPAITSDASISGKKITMQKSGVIGKYIIDENLNITEVQGNTSNIEFSYDIYERIDNKVKILIHVQDKENGLSRIEFPDGDAIIVEANKKEEKGIDYEVEIGTEYKIKIISENGATNEETILITDYWHNITKDLGEGVEIDNPAIKAAYNKSYQATLTTQGNYAITELTVIMGGQAVTTAGNNIVDIATGKIYIEKVTGDIEITVTTKELQIQYTAIAIGTSSSTSNTSSVADNSQIRGTTLYINIIANVEGKACTATLKEDNTKAVPYAITKNGIYTFVVTGIYNGKTISEEKEVTVNKYQSATGLVQYDAGDWTKEEIEELQNKSLYDINIAKTANITFKLKDSSGLNFTFGGFTYKDDTSNTTNINNGTVITSRNQSVSSFTGGGTTENIPKYDGWQILEIKDSSGNIISKETEISNKLDNLNNGERIYVTKLIHAGCPENFVYFSTADYNNRRAEYLLSSGLRQTSYSTLSSGETINPRTWQMYVDNSQKDLIADTTDKDGKTIKDIHAMTYDEAYAIIGSEVKTSGLRNTGSTYWLGSANTNNNNKYHLFYVMQYGSVDYDANSCWGVRPVVSLKFGVYIVSGDGTESSPYVLGIE